MTRTRVRASDYPSIEALEREQLRVREWMHYCDYRAAQAIGGMAVAA